MNVGKPSTKDKAGGMPARRKRGAASGAPTKKKTEAVPRVRIVGGLWREWMPGWVPPWEEGVMSPRAVRAEYAAGFWSYALGRAAVEVGVKRYRAACAVAVRQGWNPWWIRTVADVAAVEAGCWFDERRANRVVTFFERLLCHTNGRWAGEPFRLMDWQVFDVIAPMFGWMRGAVDGVDVVDGEKRAQQAAPLRAGRPARAVRRFRKAAVWTPKKNGKSGLASGLGLYLLIGDGEEGAEVYCAARARRQAGIVHRESQKMVKRSPALKGRARVLESTNRILYPGTDSHFEAISSEAGVQEGLNWSGLIFDELHVADRALVQTLEEGGVARAQSLMLAISTAGIYDPNAVGWDWWQLSKGVLEWGIQDWSFFSVMYAAPDEAAPGDPETWRRANPSLGVILQEDQMRETWERAKGSSSQIAMVRRYRLNQWVKSSHAWIEMRRWERLAGTAPDLRGRPCYGGLDLSSTTDLTAFGLWWPKTDNAPAWWRVWYWLPEENLEEAARVAQAPYRQWADEGRLLLTEGDVIDYSVIRRKIVELAEQHDVRQVAFDPWQATMLITQLQEEDGLEMVKYPQQGPVLSPALKAMETTIRRGEVRHEGCPVMQWMMSCAEVKTDHNGNCRLVKGDRRARRKIDGVIAMVMAGDLAARAENEGGGRSKWETEGASMVMV